MNLCRLGLLTVVAAQAPGMPGDAPMTNTLGMTLVRIEAGEFAMGSNDGEYDEQPVRRVRITQPFFMTATEVTNSQYEQFDPDHKQLRGKHGVSTGDDDAVVYVSWHDAIAFCQWLSRKEGATYRLPTEAEWEYACRAGTTTAYHTGDDLPEAYERAQKTAWEQVAIDLPVAASPPNAWGLHDMHGNVEEWCLDWYGPYPAENQQDPVGRSSGDGRVTRGGSHHTEKQYLRSANRMSLLPEDRNWLVGFRVVMAEEPSTEPAAADVPLWAQDVAQQRCDWFDGPDPDVPYFAEPRSFVRIPAGEQGPLYNGHNHQPAITACPNGDLLAIWYSTIREPGRELTVAAARLRKGHDQWDKPSVFWNAADRNEHGSALWWNGRDTLYHFNGLGSDGTWGKLALVMRSSQDNGVTWQTRIIDPEHRTGRNQVIAGPIRTREGYLLFACDVVGESEDPFKYGKGYGSTIKISTDEGATWTDHSIDAPTPKFEAGLTGHWIAGLHAGVVQLHDGRLFAIGRSNPIEDRLPQSISTDMGRTWSYSASPFPVIDGPGQRLVLMRLQEGPLLLISFTHQAKLQPDFAGMELTMPDGQVRRVFGMFAALSFDEGQTWPIWRLISDGKRRELDGHAWTGKFVMDETHAEPRGYLAATQTPDGVIQLISSGIHYQFNLAWLRQGKGSD